MAAQPLLCSRQRDAKVGEARAARPYARVAELVAGRDAESDGCAVSSILAAAGRDRRHALRHWRERGCLAAPSQSGLADACRPRDERASYASTAPRRERTMAERCGAAVGRQAGRRTPWEPARRAARVPCVDARKPRGARTLSHSATTSCSCRTRAPAADERRTAHSSLESSRTATARSSSSSSWSWAWSCCCCCTCYSCLLLPLAAAAVATAAAAVAAAADAGSRACKPRAHHRAHWMR
jgi:hypothetical protein